MAILAADERRGDPRAASAKRAIRVAGRADHQLDAGKRRRAGDDRLSVRRPRPSRPFIFQLPASSGRRAIVACLDPVERAGRNACDKEALADALRAEKRRFTQESRRLRGRAPVLMMRRSAGHPDRHHTQRWTLMLRGIRKASANWLGRIVMGVVMGLLAASFAIWGINDIFRGFGRSTLAKIGGTEIPIEQFRQTYNDRLQQLGRQIGRPLHAGTGERARPRPAGAQRNGRRCRPRSASAADAARHSRRRDRAAHHRRSDVPRPDRPVRPRPVRANCCAAPATPSSASSPSSGRSCCAGRSSTRWPATCRCRRRGSTPSISSRTSSAASNM